MATAAAALAIEIAANTAEAQAALGRVQAQMKGLATTAESSAAKSAASWKTAGARMTSIGKSMTKYVTVPAVAAGAASVKLAMDFDKSMALIQTQAGASGKEVRKLSKDVLDFAKSGKTQFSPNDLAQALYSIESAGIHGAKAMDTLKASSKLATVGQADLASTTKALAAAQKTGIKGSQNLTRMIGTLNATVGSGQMHMDDLVSAMGTGFLSSARAFGLTLQDVGGSLAELTKQGMPATQAATRLRMMFSVLSSPTTTAAKALGQLGLNVDDLATTMQQKGLLATLEELKSHLDGLTKVEQIQALTPIFGGGRTSAGALALLQNTKDLSTTLQNIHKHSGEVNQSFQKMQEEPSVRLERVWSQMQAVLIDMGNKLIPKLIPVVQRVANVAEKIVSAFTGAPGWLQDFLIGAVAAGPLLRMAGAMTSMVGSAKALATAGAVGGAASGAGVAARGEGAAVGSLALSANTVLFSTAAGVALGYALTKVVPDPKQYTPQQWNNIITHGVDDARISKNVGPLAHGPGAPSLGPISPTPGNFAADQAKHARDIFNAAVDALHGLLHESSVGGHKISDIVDAMITNYGSLGGAAENMSKRQARSFLSLAVEAKTPKPALRDLTLAFAKAGDLSGMDVKSLAKVTGLSTDKINNAINKGAQNWSKRQGDMRDQSGKTKTKLTGDANDLASNVGQAYVAMNKGVATGLGGLETLTNKALSALGVNPVHFDVKTVFPNFQNFPGLKNKKQKGGRIVPGVGSGDRVPAMLEPGEFVLNREAVRGIGQARLESMNNAMPRFAKGGSVMQSMVNEVNKFEARHFPYSWGGGHSGFGIQPVDCSGFVSDVLHAGGLLNAPMVSGSLMNWGKPGKGPLTVYANPEHTFMSLGGKFAGTSGSNPGGGAGWVEGGYPSSYLSDFVARTMDAAGSAVFGGAKKIANVLLKGPKGPLRSMGQAALNKVHGAANRYIASQVPSGSFGGGQGLSEVNLKGGKTVTASWYGPTAGQGPHPFGAGQVPMKGNMFAELNMGTALGGLPYGAKIGLGVNGKSAILSKEDIGAGGPGLGGTTRAVDVWQDAAGPLGLIQAGLAIAKVKRLQQGGGIPWYGNGTDFIARRPQVIGVGDRAGGERVQVTPANETKRYAITITNWQEGRGYMEEVADGVSLGNRRLVNQKRRMAR